MSKKSRRQRRNWRVSKRKDPREMLIDVQSVLLRRFLDPDSVLALVTPCLECGNLIVPTTIPATPCLRCGTWNYWHGKMVHACQGEVRLPGGGSAIGEGVIHGDSVAILVRDEAAPGGKRVLWSAQVKIVERDGDRVQGESDVS